jgi:hypothetical protein
LDPLTFGNRRERKSKATFLLDTITDRRTHAIEKGHVIYLDGSVEEIRERGTYKHKHWKNEEIERFIKNIEDIYRDVKKTVLCTRGRTAEQVAKELAKVIFLSDYSEIDVEDQLSRLSARG